MIKFRDRMARGRTRTGWLDSRHTFSFGHYHDPAQMGFRSLRVINEDRVIPGAGFPTHAHRDMEIVTYVLEGALEHKDSLGTGSVIRPGDVQRMSAGSGITHSEYNASTTEGLHFLQIWIIPNRENGPPGYEQRHFSREEKRGRWRLVADPEGRENAVTLHQAAHLYATCLEAGETIAHEIADGRGAWVQVARGIVALNGIEMKEGDGAAVEGEPRIALEADSSAEILLFDLA